uniref:Uncharacterized protein n=1 Tax=Ananas comosus var. bracteatus TaxID=296719 RepID=A0A6V7P5E6_ANACO|nr:unnamed protein product [Ananas comosus var. bracteatus]
MGFGKSEGKDRSPGTGLSGRDRFPNAKFPLPEREALGDRLGDPFPVICSLPLSHSFPLSLSRKKKKKKKERKEKKRKKKEKTKKKRKIVFFSLSLKLGAWCRGLRTRGRRRFADPTSGCGVIAETDT